MAHYLIYAVLFPPTPNAVSRYALIFDRPGRAEHYAAFARLATDCRYVAAA